MTIMEYRDVWFRRVMMRNQLVSEMFAERSAGSSDFGRAALREIFDELVPSDDEVTRLYREVAEPVHVIVENSATHMIGSLVQLLGWRDMVEGLRLFSLNKAATWRSFGVDLEAERWDKVVIAVGKMPKTCTP